MYSLQKVQKRKKKPREEPSLQRLEKIACSLLGESILSEREHKERCDFKSKAAYNNDNRADGMSPTIWEDKGDSRRPGQI